MKAPPKRGLDSSGLEGLMTELEAKIIKRILEDESAMFLALEFILKYQESSQGPAADPLAS